MVRISPMGRPTQPIYVPLPIVSLLTEAWKYCPPDNPPLLSDRHDPPTSGRLIELPSITSPLSKRRPKIRRFAGLETRNRRTLCRNKPLSDGFLMFGMRLAQPGIKVPTRIGDSQRSKASAAGQCIRATDSSGLYGVAIG